MREAAAAAVEEEDETPADETPASAERDESEGDEDDDDGATSPLGGNSYTFFVLPPFKKSRNALPQSIVTWSLKRFLRMTTSRRHLQETDEPNQAFLLFWN